MREGERVRESDKIQSRREKRKGKKTRTKVDVR